MSPSQINSQELVYKKLCPFQYKLYYRIHGSRVMNSKRQYPSNIDVMISDVAIVLNKPIFGYVRGLLCDRSSAIGTAVQSSKICDLCNIV